MRLVAAFFILISASPALALDILKLDSGYVDGAYSASLTGNSDSKILPVVAELYLFAGATHDISNPKSTYYYFPNDPNSQEALIDSIQDSTDPLMADIARFTWNFSIPYSKIQQLAVSTMGFHIIFGGPTAETLLKGIKVAATRGRAEIVSTALTEDGQEDGNGYSTGRGGIGCEERISMKKVTCSFSFSAKKD